MASRNFEKEVEECIKFLMTILKNDLVGKENSDDPESYEAMCLIYTYEKIDHNPLIRGC